MEGTYPLILDGEETGTLEVTRRGAWTEFCARSAMRPGILRISAYGEGREGYLGVLAPEGESLTLRCRRSPAQMRDFPPKIAYAGLAGRPITVQETPETQPLPAPEPCAAEPEQTPEPEPEPEAQAESEPEPEAETETPPDLADLYWYASSDGALVCFDGTDNLIALPLGDGRIPAGGGGWEKTIEGRTYRVYRTKNGRLIR